MHQLPLIRSDIEIATANQLAWYRNRDNPNQQDNDDAIKMVSKWNKSRAKSKLKIWQ